MAAIIGVFAALVIIYLVFTFFLFRMVCARYPHNRSPFPQIGASVEELLEPYKDVTRPGIAWLKEQTPETVEITSFDGLKLRGKLYENKQAKGVFISCHGYRSAAVRDFGSACSYYYNQGFTLLLIDERATGESDGKYITFGILERLDVQDWASFMAARCPNVPIVLGGISMGASAVLMAASELPEAVTALLADCGFVSAWDELIYVIRHNLHIPAVPLLRGIDFWCRLLAGFSLRQYSTVQALEGNTKPVIFIHGEADDFVPPENSRINYDACRTPRVLFTVPEAGHGMSYLVDMAGYHAVVEEFMQRYVFPKEDVRV